MQNTGTSRTNYKKHTISPIYGIPKITEKLETNKTLQTTKNTNNRGKILPQDRSSPQSIREKANRKISGLVESTLSGGTRPTNFIIKYEITRDIRMFQLLVQTIILSHYLSSSPFLFLSLCIANKKQLPAYSLHLRRSRRNRGTERDYWAGPIWV